MAHKLPGYDEYVLAAAEKRYNEAKAHLLVSTQHAVAQGWRTVQAGLAQRLADLLAYEGDLASAQIIYDLSEQLDPGSLLAKLDHAKFLWRTALNSSAGRAKCEEIIHLASTHPFPGSDDDFSSDEYAAAAKRLIDEISELE